MFIRLLSAYTIGSFRESLLSNLKLTIKCVSLNNQLCKARPTLIHMNSNGPLYYQLTVSVNKCSEIGYTIDDSYAWVCASGKVKSI